MPGGRAAYPSTVLMNAVPARVAGVERLVMVTPPGPEGEPNPTVLAAAHLAGVTEVYRVGGAQAIAALAWGTESIPRVDVISGPGNLYVTLAKKAVYGQVGIDSLAGPSEVLIIADHSAVAEQVAADLMAQAEHDPLAAAILITTDAALARRGARGDREAAEPPPPGGDRAGGPQQLGADRDLPRPGERRPCSATASRLSTWSCWWRIPSRWRSASVTPAPSSWAPGPRRPSATTLAGPEPHPAHLRHRPFRRGPQRRDLPAPHQPDRLQPWGPGGHGGSGDHPG